MFGTIDNKKDTDEGVLYEIAIPKALLGLSDKSSFAILPELYNADGAGIKADTLTNGNVSLQGRWPKVVLD